MRSSKHIVPPSSSFVASRKARILEGGHLVEIEKLKKFVEEKFAADRKVEVNEGDNWFSTGLVNSMGVMQIVSFVERELKAEIPEEDVTVDNFKSLKDVANYLERRKARRSSQS
jgi:acyl carrier protein